MPLTDGQVNVSRSASQFLREHGCSPIDGAPVEPTSRVSRPRLARVCKDTEKLTLDI